MLAAITPNMIAKIGSTKMVTAMISSMTEEYLGSIRGTFSRNENSIIRQPTSMTIAESAAIGSGAT